MSVNFDERGIAQTEGTVTVFNYNAVTKEYSGRNQEFLSVGVGIPACSVLDIPLEPRLGFAVCRKSDNSSWEYLPDHRGEIVYSIESGEPIEITMPGDYPDNTTPLKPQTPHDYWNGSEWVTDTETAHAAEVAKADADKSNRLTAAKQHISLWQTQLQLGMISDADKAKLIEWMHYITALQAVDTSTAPDINWPQQPAE
ncbi:tail fiber assembly protein [Plesiomonas shigelloides]|nr:tail fiber assembly protein [Plesiomonas shigelloides]KAB7701064.1 tail fiber assembly protein [Plesiomonas shigelloides]